jgi:two-component system KDP operon response regulator KdpE
MDSTLEAAKGSDEMGVLKPHPRVLVIDGDASTGRMLRLVLESERYRVAWSRSGAEALRQAVDSRPDVVVLELDLPDGSGFRILESLREWCEAPVVILSARTAIADKVRALDAGANDYVVKPFAPEELAARLRVQLRCEAPICDGPILVSGKLRINMATRRMTIGEAPLELTATEEALLYVLARHAGKIVPRERLVRAVWGIYSSRKIRDLQVHIGRLRRKLGLLGAGGLLQGEGIRGYNLSLRDAES